MLNDNELEDGEIVDYTPLERPCNSLTVRSSIRHQHYSDNSADDNEPSDSDSDSSSCTAKKPKLTKRQVSTSHSHKSNLQPRKKYNIWSSELQESKLTEDLLNCDVEQKEFDRSRDVESYDYRIAYSLPPDVQPLKYDHSLPVESPIKSRDSSFQKHRSNKRRHDERRNGKVQVRRDPSTDDENQDKGRARILQDLTVTADNTDEEVATDIANKLCEEKDQLILKAVTVLGKQKAIDIFQETKSVEADGGMLVMNGSRQRTPGGVFLFKLRHDNNITKEMANKIFEEDAKERTAFLKKKKAEERKKRVKRNFASQPSVLSEQDIPVLLSRSELIERRLEAEGEQGVRNPPPSPATDGRENSSDGAADDTSFKPVATYQDDFLDINTDEMDLF